jgi:glycosyltransferase involved in cell wall biosynthesis
MKILLINYEYPPIGAGAANATYNMALALKELGHDVFIFTANFKENTGLVTENGIDILRIKCKRKYADRSNILEMLSFLFRGLYYLPSFIKKNRPDGSIVFFSFPCGPLGWFANKLYSIPYIVSLRGGDVPGTEAKLKNIHRLLKPIRYLIFNKSIAVVANSESLKILSERADSFPVKIIPNGVDTAFYKPIEQIDIDDNKFHFIFVGRFQSQKNVFYLLEQFEKIDKRSKIKLHLHLVGDGPQKQELHAFSKTLGIDSNITWHGWLSKKTLLKYYQQSHCLVLPSLYEGLSNVVLEAMACGLPIIASNVAGNDALVQYDENGYLFELNDNDSLSNYMIKIAENKAKAYSLGHKGREITELNYSWDSVVKEYIQLFKK